MRRGGAASIAALGLTITSIPACKEILDIRDGEPLAAAGGAGSHGGSGGSDGGPAVSFRSCMNLSPTCGRGRDQDCCAALFLPAGTFHRSFDGKTYTDQGYSASISDFVLDRYEVTVGRFRAFVEAFPVSKPGEGSGRNVNDGTDTGWDMAWSPDDEGQDSMDHLPASKRELRSLLSNAFTTWTEAPGANETLPITGVNWYTAFAFCIWDGGRLPTEAEWNYAAAGGSRQLVYPWGDQAPDDSLAVYCGAGEGGSGATGAGASSGVAGTLGGVAGAAPAAGGTPDVPSVRPCITAKTRDVGSRSPEGDGFFDHADLAGNVYEWTLDQYIDPYSQVTCINCSNRTPASMRVIRGGSSIDDAPRLASSYREGANPERAYGFGIDGAVIGFRCARSTDRQR